MQFTWPDAGALSVNTAQILDDARSIMAAAGITETTENLKLACTTVVGQTYQSMLHDEIARVLEGALIDHISDQGEYEDSFDIDEWNESLNDNIRGALGEIESAVGLEAFQDKAFNVGLHEPERPLEVAGELAALATPLKMPAPKDAGKFLSKIGIAVGAAAAVEVLADTPAGLVPLSDAELAARINPPVVEAGSVTTYVSAQPTEPGVTFAVPPPPPGKPDKAAVSAAMQQAYAASVLNIEELGAKLGYSRQTLMNYVTGRTQPKLTHKQAQELRGYLDTRIAEMQEAAAVFAAYRE